jgi:hypothetical protein
LHIRLRLEIRPRNSNYAPFPLCMVNGRGKRRSQPLDFN